MLFRPLLAAVLLSLAPSSVVVEYVIPRPGNFPHDPAVGPDGIVWYTDYANSTVGRLDPETGRITDVATPTPNSLPHGIEVGADGMVWYTGQRAGVIGRLDPATMTITEFPLPPETDHPHTPHLLGGRVWFTDANNNRYGVLDPATGRVQTWESAEPGNTIPYGLVHGPDGMLYIAHFGINAIGQVNPADGSERLFRLPNAEARPRRLQVASDGIVYYTDYARGFLGALDPRSGAVREFPCTTPNAGPYGMVIDNEGMVWFNESANSLMRKFDPRSGRMESIRIPTAGSTVRHISIDRTRGRLWLALSGTGRLGKIDLHQ